MKLNVINFAMNNTPKVEEQRGKHWLTYGADNLYPEMILDLYNNSTINKAIIDRRKNMIVGDGIIYKNGDTETKAKTEFFLNKIDVKSLIDKSALDLELFGGFAWNVIWSRDKTKIVDIRYLSFKEFRSGIPNEDMEVEEYWKSNDWSSLRKNKPEAYQSFNFEAKGNPSQVYYCFKHNPTLKYYPIPDYAGGLNDIDTHIQISNFNNSFIKNGMTPSVVIKVNNVPGEEEQQQVLRDLEEQYAGSNNAGKFIVMFSNDSTEAPVVETIQLNNAADYFQNLEKSTKINIIQSHQIPETLVQNISGSLSNKKELLDAKGIFFDDVIQFEQNFLLDKFNDLLDINGLCLIDIKKPETRIEFSENILKEMLTTNELRAMAGFEEIDDNTNDGPPLAVILGVGGTQSLQSILIDPVLSVNQKLGIIQTLFGLSEEDAMKMLDIEKK